MVIYKYLPVFAAERRELGGCYAAERGVCPRFIPPEQEGLTVGRNMINGGCGDTGDLLDSAWSAGYRMMTTRQPVAMRVAGTAGECVDAWCPRHAGTV
jgi:hypothetical protein